jgi:hypothetical protein
VPDTSPSTAKKQPYQEHNLLENPNHTAMITQVRATPHHIVLERLSEALHQQPDLALLAPVERDRLSVLPHADKAVTEVGLPLLLHEVEGHQVLHAHKEKCLKFKHQVLHAHKVKCLKFKQQVVHVHKEIYLEFGRLGGKKIEVLKLKVKCFE